MRYQFDRLRCATFTRAVNVRLNVYAYFYLTSLCSICELPFIYRFVDVRSDHFVNLLDLLALPPLKTSFSQVTTSQRKGPKKEKGEKAGEKKRDKFLSCVNMLTMSSDWIFYF
jgi:hypothetical protein